jgi:hypothetical protein
MAAARRPRRFEPVYFSFATFVYGLLKNPVGKVKSEGRSCTPWSNNSSCISSATNVSLARQTDG